MANSYVSGNFWITGFSYAEFALFHTGHLHFAHWRPWAAEIKDLVGPLGQDFSLVVNLRWREIQIFRLPELLGWDLLLPIGCMRMR